MPHSASSERSICTLLNPTCKKRSHKEPCKQHGSLLQLRCRTSLLLGSGSSTSMTAWIQPLLQSRKQGTDQHGLLLLPSFPEGKYRYKVLTSEWAQRSSLPSGVFPVGPACLAPSVQPYKLPPSDSRLCVLVRNLAHSVFDRTCNTAAAQMKVNAPSKVPTMVLYVISPSTTAACSS